MLFKCKHHCCSLKRSVLNLCSANVRKKLLSSRARTHGSIPSFSVVWCSEQQSVPQVEQHSGKHVSQHAGHFKLACQLCLTTNVSLSTRNQCKFCVCGSTTPVVCITVSMRARALSKMLRLQSQKVFFFQTVAKVTMM